MKKVIFIFLIFGLFLNSVDAMSNNTDSVIINSDQKSTQKVEQGDQLDLEALDKKLDVFLNLVQQEAQKEARKSDSTLESYFKSQKMQKIMKVLLNISSKLTAVAGSASEKFCSTLKWISARLDTILTKQGALKTALILGILASMYCYCFPPEIFKNLITKITSAVVQGASDVAAAATKGILTGAAEGIKENKEQLKNILVANKDVFKEAINDFMYEAAVIKREAEINYRAGEIGSQLTPSGVNTVVGLHNLGSWTSSIGTAALGTLINILLRNKYEIKE